MPTPSCRTVEFSFAEGEGEGGREIRVRGNEKVHFGRHGSQVTFPSRVLFHRHRHYCRCLPTLFHVLALPRARLRLYFSREEARTCHGKTLSSARIKQVMAHGTKLFPRGAVTVSRTVSVSKDRPPNRRCPSGLCARIASRKYQKFLD